MLCSRKIRRRARLHHFDRSFPLPPPHPLLVSVSQRDAWAATFEQRLAERKTPRTDCPAQLPDAPKSLGAAHARHEAALYGNFDMILAA